MKLPVLTNTLTPGHGFKALSLAGAMAVLTGVSASAWSSPTLIADSTVSNPFLPGVRHGADPDVQVNSGNSGISQVCFNGIVADRCHRRRHQ